MCTLYESIISLCENRGIRGGKMCLDLGFSKSLLTDLKAGRKKSITSETAQKIADYFGVSVDRVLNGPYAEKAPTPKDERVSDEDIKLALFGGDGEVTDEMWDEALFAVEMIKARYKRKKEKNG